MKQYKFYLTTFICFIIIFSLNSIYPCRKYSKQELKYFQTQLKKNNNNQNVRIASNKENTDYFCIANTKISTGTPIFSLPKEQAICAYNLFPFKYEIVQTLMQIKKDTGSLDNALISQLVLTYYVLYLKNEEKYKINKFIIDKEVKHYYNTVEIDRELVKLLPDAKISGYTSDSRHLAILRDYGHSQDDKIQLLESLFTLFLSNINKTKLSEKIYPWVSNFKEFLNAYAIVAGESTFITLDDFDKIDGYNEKSDNSVQSQNQKQNHNFNTKFGNQAPCIFSLGRICRYFQSKISKEGQTRPMQVKTREKYFDIYISKSLSKGSEISFSYSVDQSNLTLLMNFGEVLKNNVWDFYGISVDHAKDAFNEDQFKLCKELGCLKATDKFEKQPEKLDFKIYKNIFSKDLMNYGRSFFLKKKFDYQKVLKTFLTSENNIWTFVNEVKALLFYYKELDKYTLSRRPLYKQQMHRNNNKKKGISPKDKLFNSVAELIYRFDINYKTILLKHDQYVLAKIIKLTNFDISRLGVKYIATKKK